MFRNSPMSSCHLFGGPYLNMDVSLCCPVIWPSCIFLPPVQVVLTLFPKSTQRCVPNPPHHKGSVCPWAPAILRVQTPAVVHAILLYMTRFVKLFWDYTTLFMSSCTVLELAECGRFFLLRGVQWRSCLSCTLAVLTMLQEKTCWTCWGSPL